MKKEELTAYLDPLLAAARRKTSSVQDAEDIVSETVLRALAFLERGGEIRYPKTWLFRTFENVWNDFLRKKYRSPVTVELTAELPLSSEDSYAFLSEGDEAADVRREVNRLSREYRAIFVRYYWRGESVAKIAQALGVPEGTVKSRLSGGRKMIRKGLEKQMTETKAPFAEGPEKLPETLGFSNAGWADGLADLVHEDLIVQNVLIEAYEKPVSTVELSKRLGIPTVYLEPVVQRLVREKLMKESASGQVSTDFIIFTVEDRTRTFEKQLAFAKEHFDAFWEAVAAANAETEAAPWWSGLNERQRSKMKAHLALRILSQFTHTCCGLGDNWQSYYRHTARGSWLGFGYRYPAGFDRADMGRLIDFQICGGLRTTIRNDVPGTKEFAAFAFDTTLCDRSDPWRFWLAGDYNMYFSYIGRILWKAYNGEEPSEDVKIPEAMLGAIPQFIEYGLLARDGDGKLSCDIPLIPQPDYIDLRDRIIAGAVRTLDGSVGDDYRAFLRGTKVPVPAHLTEIPESLPYFESSVYIAMAVIREAYGRGLHLAGVDYCCPPVIACWLPAGT